MQPLANTLLLVDGIILVLQSYRVSAYVYVPLANFPPGRQNSAIRLRRVYLIALPLAGFCFIAAGLHATLRGTHVLGPAATIAALAFGGLASLAIIWCAIEIRLDRKGYRVT